MYMFKGKTEAAATITNRTKTKVALSSKELKDLTVTHPQLTRLVISIGISTAIGTLFMMLTAPEQPLAWRPVKDHTTIE